MTKTLIQIPFLKLLGIPIFALAWILFSGCTSTPLTKPRNVETTIPFVQKINESETPVVGEAYYLRHNIWTTPHGGNYQLRRGDKPYYVTSTYNTTNYSSGELIPVNTKVVLLLLDDERMVIGLPDSEYEFTKKEPNDLALGMTTFKRIKGYQSIWVNNARKFTEKNMSEIARNMLSSKPFPVEEMKPDIATAIKNGQLKVGMSKSEVLMARGFPPSHRTFSLESKRWIYWRSRIATQEIEFEDEKLAKGL